MRGSIAGVPALRWIAIVLALTLGGCAKPGQMAPVTGATVPNAESRPTGAWKFDRRVDPATGRPMGKAFVIATKVTLRQGQVLPQPAGLQLECFKGQPVVQVKYAERVGANRSASVAYRFDDKPGHTAAVRFLSDTKTFVIENREAVEEFVTELREADKLIVSIDSLVRGLTQAEFPVRSAETAIESAYAECPLPDKPVARRTQ